MSGGVVQLVATGAQDAWLTGNPEVSFFRASYRRYTHYANSIENQTIQGTPIAGGISTVRFERKGDLLSYVYFTARDQNGTGIHPIDWSKVFDKFELYIGGSLIDTQDFTYMTEIDPLVGAQTYAQRYLNNNVSGPTNKSAGFFPLKLFFCKDTAVALPLVSLAFHDVELRIYWSSSLSQTINFGAPTGPAITGLPQASMNVAQTVTVNGVNVLGSNLANVNYFTYSGVALAPGQILTTSTTPDSNVSGTIQSTNVMANSNVIISFSNLTATTSNIAFAAGAKVNVFAPTCTAIVTGVSPTTISGGQTTATLTIADLTSTSGAGLAIGQYVSGLPLNGPVYISNVNSNSSITVSFNSGQAASASSILETGTVDVPYTVIGMFPSTTISSTTYSQLQYMCWANFIYLDTAERKYLAEKTSDLLVTQVQRVPIASATVQELALAHPVKFLAWPAANYQQVYANGANSAAASNYQLKVQINGTDIGLSRYLHQFTDVVQYYHTPYGYVHNNGSSNVGIINYCLDTSKLQPTGTLNFSRLDTYRLVTPVSLVNPQGSVGLLALANPAVTSPYLYAVNYNILRIEKGMGSLLYAN